MKLDMKNLKNLDKNINHQTRLIKAKKILFSGIMLCACAISPHIIAHTSPSYDEVSGPIFDASKDSIQGQKGNSFGGSLGSAPDGDLDIMQALIDYYNTNGDISLSYTLNGTSQNQDLTKIIHRSIISFADYDIYKDSIVGWDNYNGQDFSYTDDGWLDYYDPTALIKMASFLNKTIGPKSDEAKKLLTTMVHNALRLDNKLDKSPTGENQKVWSTDTKCTVDVYNKDKVYLRTDKVNTLFKGKYWWPIGHRSMCWASKQYYDKSGNDHKVNSTDPWIGNNSNEGDRMLMREAQAVDYYYKNKSTIDKLFSDEKIDENNAFKDLKESLEHLLVTAYTYKDGLDDTHGMEEPKVIGPIYLALKVIRTYDPTFNSLTDSDPSYPSPNNLINDKNWDKTMKDTLQQFSNKSMTTLPADIKKNDWAGQYFNYQLGLLNMDIANQVDNTSGSQTDTINVETLNQVENQTSIAPKIHQEQYRMAASLVYDGTVSEGMGYALRNAYYASLNNDHDKTYQTLFNKLATGYMYAADETIALSKHFDPPTPAGGPGWHTTTFEHAYYMGWLMDLCRNDDPQLSNLCKNPVDITRGHTPTPEAKDQTHPQDMTNWDMITKHWWDPNTRQFRENEKSTDDSMFADGTTIPITPLTKDRYYPGLYYDPQNINWQISKPKRITGTSKLAIESNIVNINENDDEDNTTRTAPAHPDGSFSHIKFEHGVTVDVHPNMLMTETEEDGITTKKCTINGLSIDGKFIQRTGDNVIIPRSLLKQGGTEKITENYICH